MKFEQSELIRESLEFQYFKGYAYAAEVLTEYAYHVGYTWVKKPGDIALTWIKIGGIAEAIIPHWLVEQSAAAKDTGS